MDATQVETGTEQRELPSNWRGLTPVQNQRLNEYADNVIPIPPGVEEEELSRDFATVEELEHEIENRLVFFDDQQTALQQYIPQETIAQLENTEIVSAKELRARVKESIPNSSCMVIT